MKAAKFGYDQTTDAKRLARGEQYKAALSLIRSRSVDRACSRVLMLAGGNPSEEIGIIRGLWRGSRFAKILAADLNADNVRAALDSGADDGFVGDIGDFPVRNRRPGSSISHREDIPDKVRAFGKLDLLSLDFCGTVSSRMRKIVHKYNAKALSAGGVGIVTFSYGRDVAEAFLAESRSGFLHNDTSDCAKALMGRGLRESLVGRIIYLSRKDMRIVSIATYHGNQMPMCSVLYVRTGNGAPVSWPYTSDVDHISVIGVSDSDLVDAVDNFDVASLYGLPEERVLAMRRSAAARRAVASRKGKAIATLAPLHNTEVAG